MPTTTDLLSEHVDFLQLSIVQTASPDLVTFLLTAPTEATSIMQKTIQYFIRQKSEMNLIWKIFKDTQSKNGMNIRIRIGITRDDFSYFKTKDE